MLHWLLLHQSATYVALVVTAPVCHICCTGCYCTSLPDMFQPRTILFQSGKTMFQYGKTLFQSGKTMFQCGTTMFQCGTTMLQSGTILFQSGNLCSRSDRDCFVGICYKIFSWIFYSIDLADQVAIVL